MNKSERSNETVEKKSNTRKTIRNTDTYLNTSLILVHPDIYEKIDKVLLRKTGENSKNIYNSKEYKKINNIIRRWSKDKLLDIDMREIMHFIVFTNLRNNTVKVSNYEEVKFLFDYVKQNMNLIIKENIKNYLKTEKLSVK